MALALAWASLWHGFGIGLALARFGVALALARFGVGLALASNKEKDAITDIVNLINSGPHSVGVITIADNVNQVYASTHITDIAGSIDT